MAKNVFVWKNEFYENKTSFLDRKRRSPSSTNPNQFAKAHRPVVLDGPCQRKTTKNELNDPNSLENKVPDFLKIGR